jgi:TetR/AcrR family transcriptional repressor of uid operon
MAIKSTKETPTAKRRKAQVLGAAVECFRREGFHRTSMSQISAAAGMRSGHIYHYFGSKEKIVEAIVEREHGELGQLIEDAKVAMQHTDAVSAIVEETLKSTVNYMDSDRAALKMEVLAEAARNPQIASLVQSSDAEIRGAFKALLDGEAQEIMSRTEILSALVEGLSSRVLLNPKVDTMLDQEMLRRVVRFVLTT